MVKRKKKSEDNSVRNPGLKTLQQSVLKITDVAIRKRGFVESALIHKWTSIVGKEIAAWSVPNRLVFLRGSTLDATLHLDVLSARALEIQHNELVILERINVVFGYKAINKIAIRQVNSLSRTVKQLPTPAVLTEAEKSWVSDQIKNHSNAELKNALEALGQAILSRK
tara:strand:- start:525 stop:1028 length:504 start_codon:yes stop_codon:yes gene_type:complete